MRGILISTIIQAVYERAYGRDSHKHDHTSSICMSVLMRGILINTIIQAVYERAYERPGLTYFYKWPITCEIQILNLFKCGSGICNRYDQRLLLLASRFFRLTKSLWKQGRVYSNMCTQNLNSWQVPCQPR